jgi:hypothetical protein
MDHDDRSAAPAAEVDWVGAMAALDDCDGYVVLAADPQTGEVDAHGPFVGLGAVSAAEDLRATFDREDLTDVVVQIVRWHTSGAKRAA